MTSSDLGNLEPIGTPAKPPVQPAAASPGTIPSLSADSSPLYEMAALGNVASLGCGYDITQGMNFEGAIKQSLFEFQMEQVNGRWVLSLTEPEVRDQKTAPDKLAVEHQTRPFQSYQRTYGATSNQYAEDVTKSLGIDASYGGFGGSVSATFSNTTSLKSSHSLLTVRFVKQLGSLTLPTGYQRFVKPHVLEKLKNGSDLEDLFKTFGTHFITSCQYGGYCDCSVVVKSAENSRVTKVEEALKATIGSVAETAKSGEPAAISAPNPASGGLTASRKKEIEETLKREIDRRDWRSGGGSVTVTNEEQIPAWSASVNKLPAVCKVERLTPIWTLVTDPAQRAVVERAALDYLAACRAKTAFAIAATLQVAKCDEFEEVFSSEGMGTANDMTVYLPIRDADHKDYFFLGHVAENHFGRARTSTYIVKDPTSGEKYLRKPQGCTLIWKSSGSGFSDFSIWKMLPPKDFFALGCILSKSHDKPDLDQFRCVHKDLLTEARIGDSIWSNSIGKAKLLLDRSPLSTQFNALARIISAGEASGALRIGDHKVELYAIEPKTGIEGVPLSLFWACDYWNDPKGTVHTLLSEAAAS